MSKTLTHRKEVELYVVLRPGLKRGLVAHLEAHGITTSIGRESMCMLKTLCQGPDDTWRSMLAARLASACILSRCRMGFCLLVFVSEKKEILFVLVPFGT